MHERRPSVALYLGRRMFRHEAWRIVRQSLVVTVFVIFIFTLTAMNVSFDLTFHKTAGAVTEHGQLIMYENGTLSFGVPPDRWVWNASQAAVDNATIQIWSKAKGAFDALTWASAIMLVAKEATQNWNEAKQENEEHKSMFGLMYLIGIRPNSVWTTFFMQKFVVFAIGIAVGSALSVLYVLPYILAQFHGTIGALFFQSFDYTISFLTACLLASMSMTMRSYVLMRGTRHKKLKESVMELA